MPRTILLISCALILASAPAEARLKIEPLEGGARFRVTFEHQPVIGVDGVALAGAFNGWSKSSAPMQDADRDGTYALSLVLPRGRHLYKFVINGYVWQHGGDNPQTDAHGH